MVRQFETAADRGHYDARPLRPGLLQQQSGEYFAVRGAAAALIACASGLLFRSVDSGAEGFVNGGHSAYAFSLLAAGLLALPGLIFLTRNLFLNIRRRGA